MKNSKIVPTGVESEFAIEELFFSTTNKAGVIQSGNDVFVRLSKHPLEKLLGAPHNIIRHPRMPRAIFELFWRELLAGNTIGAYVQNLAADGSHYWVFAIATPLPDGFLSVRLKPTSEMFTAVSELYESLRVIEVESHERGEPHAEGMRLAGEQLLVKLEELGYPSYTEFMYTAFQEEMRCRDATLNKRGKGLKLSAQHDAAELTDSSTATRSTTLQLARERLHGVCEHIAGLKSLQDGLDDKVSFAINVARRFERAATNTAIRATALEITPQALDTIAAHLGSAAMEVRKGANSFQAQAQRTINSLDRNSFQLDTVRLAIEAAEQFCAGTLDDSTEPWDEKHPAEHQSLEAILSDLSLAIGRLLDEVTGSVNILSDDLDAMRRDSEVLRRAALMLRFSQLAGVIEVSRLNAQESVGPLLQDIGANIDHAQNEFAELISQIEGLLVSVGQVPAMVDALRQDIQSVTVEEPALSA